MITVPEFAVAAVDQIPGVLGYTDQPVVVVAMHMLGDVTGSLVFLMPESKAWRLSALVLRRPIGSADRLDLLAESSLRETANILGGAYAGALGTITGGVLMLSVPSFGIQPPDLVLANHRTPGEADQLGLCIETKFTLDGEETEFGGHLLMLPDQASLSSILQVLRV
jgi:chemotaxis protein CheY-P-specific phosphatase CheC